MKTTILFLASLVLFSTAATANPTYIMPQTPMTSTEIQELFNVLANYIPLGNSSYIGKGDDGLSCQVNSSLDIKETSAAFSILPRIQLGLQYGNNAGSDAVSFYLVDLSESTSSDHRIKNLHMAVVNRGGFGADRMLSYDFSTKDGKLIDYKTLAASGRFSLGKEIIPNIPELHCAELSLQN